MLLQCNTNPDMCSTPGVNRSEKISGGQADNTIPDMCSASEFNRSEKVPDEQAEKLLTEDKTDGNPQFVSEGARYTTWEKRCPAYLNHYVTDLDEVITDSDQVLSVLIIVIRFQVFPRHTWKQLNILS